LTAHDNMQPQGMSPCKKLQITNTKINVGVDNGNFHGNFVMFLHYTANSRG